MSETPSSTTSDNRERNEDRIYESVDTLKQLYSVVIALALTEAIVSLVTRTDTGVTVHYAALPWFVALVVTLIPFHHGAMRHLDDAYVFDPVRHPKPTFLLDYLILFTEAGTLVWLGLVLTSPQAFLSGYTLLLIIDVFWAVATRFLTNSFEKVQYWLYTNIATLLVIALFHWVPFLEWTE